MPSISDWDRVHANRTVPPLSIIDMDGCNGCDGWMDVMDVMDGCDSAELNEIIGCA